MNYFVLLTSFLFCGYIHANEHSHHHHDHHHHSQSELNSTPSSVSEESIYNFSETLINQEGEKIKLSDFLGKYVIITMAYTSCQYSCPIIISKLKEIEMKIDKEMLKNTVIVLISFDTKRDTPEKLQKYMKSKSLRGAHWQLLKPESQESVQEIAALLGVNFKPEANGEFAHSNIINLLDKKGVVQHQLSGMGSDDVPIIKKIRESK